MINGKFNRKRMLFTAVLSSVLFAVLYTLLSANGYHSWFRSVILEGEYKDYNMAKQIMHTYPFYGWRSWYSIHQKIAMFVVATTSSVYISVLLNREIFSSRNTYLYLMLPVVLLTYIIALVSMAAQDCVLGLEDILNEYFGPVIASYINAGPNQLAVISCIMSAAIVYMLYQWGWKND